MMATIVAAGPIFTVKRSQRLVTARNIAPSPHYYCDARSTVDDYYGMRNHEYPTPPPLVSPAAGGDRLRVRVIHAVQIALQGLLFR